MKHEQSWIALAEILGPRSPFLKPLVTKFGTPDAVFAASEQAIRAVIPDIGQGTLAALLRKSSDEEAARITLWCHRNGVRILTLDSTDYPARLRAIDEPPAVLYCKGAFPTFDGRLAVGVVGTRKADAYGEQVTYKLSFELAAAGAVIVSGMAAGLDAIAAAAAINAGSETIAVITEDAPGTKPHGWNFPMRNRIISALSSAVLVTEAGENSGSLITARYAVVQGKELFAVPGDITSLRSKGTNRLLCDGAIPALEAGEMLERFRFLYRDRIRLQALPEAMQYSTLTPEALRRYGLQVTPAEPQETPEKPKREKRFRRKKSETVAENTTISEKTAPDTSSLTPRQRELFDLLPEGSFSVDVLASRGVPVAEAMSTLTVFEIYGLILSRPGGVYQKK